MHHHCSVLSYHSESPLCCVVLLRVQVGGLTAAMKAASLGHVRCVDHLAAFGANLDILDNVSHSVTHSLTHGHVCIYTHIYYIHYTSI